MENLPTRNNNPGDLRDTSSGGFKSFSSPQEGYAALLNDLHAKQTGTTTTGLGPSSTLADFAKTYAPPTENNSAQYAANLANHMGVSPDATLSSLDLGKWADAVASSEGFQGNSATSNSGTAYAPPVNPQQSSQGAGPALAYAPPVPPSANQFGVPAANAAGGNGQESGSPESFMQKAGDVAKGVGNFLFPIAGDLYNDVTGKNSKTFLQQAGDAGLSALPFIPGLGEVGEGARGLEAGAEAGKALLPSLLNNPFARGAVSGYGAGTAAGLSQGKSIPDALMPNAQNLGGAVLGAAIPGGLAAAGGIAKHIAGISPQIENALGDVGNTALYDKYIQTAKARAGDVRAPSPLNLAADQLDAAGKIIQQKAKQAGQEVGATNRAGANVPLTGVQGVVDNFRNNVQERFGYIIQGNKLVPDKNRGIGVTLTAPQSTRLLNAFKQIQALQKKGTVQSADDVMTNLDNLLDHSVKDNYGKSVDPLQGILGQARHDINEVARTSSPEFAGANDRFAELKSLQREMNTIGGKNLQRGELLMRRVFSGDKSGEVNDLFGKIKNETGIDLVNHAVLAKHAIETVGDKSQKTLLQQALEGAATAHQGGILPALAGIGAGVAKKTFANPEKIGRSLVKGKRGGLLPSFLKVGAIESSRAIPANP